MPRLYALALVAVLMLGTPPVSAATDAVAWQPAAADADIERAFARARTEGKPLLLYWGAQWCPPCNRLKATLFNRRDFIERSRAFVAVQLDGDVPGAQKVGARFKVRGYPTLVLFSPDGAELTRLPGEVEAPQVLKVMQLGLAGGRSVEAVLADASAGRTLSANEWRMLAYYSFDTADQRVVPAQKRPDLLASLAAACPPSQARTRLMLKALAASDAQRGLKADAKLRRQVLAVLDDPAAVRAHMDVLTGSAAEIAKALEASGAGAEVSAAFERALRRLEADATLSRADRTSALYSRVELARQSAASHPTGPKLPAPLLREVRASASRMDREISDGHERQAVITAAAYVLARAGLLDDSDALLQTNLAKSHSPYYLMSQLAANARQRGDAGQALRWYRQAFEQSIGPATRLQWGMSYLSALVDLAPGDAPRIEEAASLLIAEAGAQSAAFYERGARSLERAAAKLSGWNRDGEQAAVLQRLQAQLDTVCGKLGAADPQRPVCEGLLSGPRSRESG